jgi:LacI family transcriptional regulator
MKRTTIKDLARALGIATSTVSRALSDHPDISEAMRRRVREAALALNYTPNLSAKHLRTQYTRMIALILPEVNMFFTPSLMNGINAIVESFGYTLFILQSDNTLEKESKLLDYCAELSVEGILISLSEETSHTAHFSTCQNADIPIVLIDKTLESEDFAAFNFDDASMSQRAVAHLIAHGHTNIVGVFANPKLRMTRLREEGFRAALQHYGIPLDEKLILTIREPNEVDGSIKSVLAQRPNATAFFTMSDELLVQTYHSILRSGFRIPTDKALISISDGQTPYYLFPNITHIRSSGEALGRKAAAFLFNLVHKKYGILDSEVQTDLVDLYSV